MRAKSLLLFLALVALYVLDPYSRGEAGAQAVFSGRNWQTAAVACLTALLIIGAVLAFRGNRRARRFVELEATGFILLNTVYVARDGATRFIFGYEHRPTGLIVVIVGIILRIVLHRVLRASPEPGREVRAASEFP